MKSILLSIMIILFIGCGSNEDTSVKKSLKGMSEVDFKKRVNLQLHTTMEKSQKLFNKNVQEIQQEFQALILNMNAFHKYASPIAENSTLISGGSFAASFFIPGFDSINSAISFIAETDSKIHSYIKATKDSKINIINQKINTFHSTHDIESIDDIRSELDVYRIDLVELSNDLKKVEDIAISIKEFSIQADQYSEKISNAVTDYGNDITDAVNSSEYGKKLLTSITPFFNDEKSEKTTVNNSEVEDNNLDIKSITKIVQKLETDIENNKILLLESLRLADNLSSDFIIIKTFQKINL